MSEIEEAVSNPGSPAEVFWAFLKLGLTSFGGPIAHLGYFRAEFVQGRRWLSDAQFAQLLAICQFLPGPASSQLGFSLGLLRAGWPGAIAAFLAFTLPSALLLVAFAAALPHLSGPVGLALVHGLKLVACAVVADAIVGMSKKLCPDSTRKVIAILTAALLLVATSVWTQLLVVAIAAVTGALLLRGTFDTDSSARIPLCISHKTGGVFIIVFLALLIGLPLVAASFPASEQLSSGHFSSEASGLAAVAAAFYRAGALVFGGGHVVLPLLQDSVVANGWVSSEQFLAGYGASQAIPGPMFAFSAYLGAVLSFTTTPYLSAAIALVFMFLPGFLLVCGVLPFWRSVSHHPVAINAIAGINAAVVGLLGAALYNPIFTSGISGSDDLAITLVAFALLAVWRVSPLFVVLWCVLASVLPVWI